MGSLRSCLDLLNTDDRRSKNQPDDTAQEAGACSENRGAKAVTSVIGRRGDGGGALIRDWTWFEPFRRRVSHISERDVHRGVSLVSGIQSPHFFSDLY